MNLSFTGPQLASEEYCFTETKYSRGKSRLIDLDKLFPRLHTLKVWSNLPRRVKTFHIAISDLAGLPPTLTHLKWPSLSLFASTFREMMALLPPSLAHLDVSLQVEDPSPRACVVDVGGPSNSPASLESIRRIIWNASAILDALPRSLKRCQLDTSHFDRKYLESLPLQLEELNLDYDMYITPQVSEDWTSYLPRSLLKLTIGSFFLRPVIDELPRTLTELCCDLSSTLMNALVTRFQDGSASRSSIASIWPETLTSLSCRLESLEVGHLAALPLTLNILELRLKLPGPGTFRASELPSALTSLNTSVFGVTPVFYVDNFPSTLADAQLPSQTSENGDAAREILLLLPSSLSHLHLSSLNSRYSQDMLNLDWPFPTHLSSLVLSYFHSELIPKLPPLLTSLRINRLVNPASDTTILSKLPSTLQTLEIEYLEPQELVYDDDSFSNLANLSSLRISSKCLFRSKVLRGISKRLLYLMLSFTSLEAEDASFLPPLLLRFRPPRVTLPFPGLERYWPVMCAETAPEEIQSDIYKRLREANF